MAIERVESGIAKKWEFIYMKDYNEDGTEYPLRKGRRYIVHYDTNKNETYTDEKNNILIRRNNHTLYSQYKKVKSISREVYLKPYQIYLTEKMIKKGTITRYFVKYIHDIDKSIFEVSKQGFQTAGSLYKKVSLDWSLTGDIFEVSKKNKRTLLVKESRFKGIQDFLDPLEFYQKVLTPKDVVREKLKKLRQQDSGKNIKGILKSSLKSKGSKLTTTVAPPRSQSTTRTTSSTGRTGY